MIRVNALIVTFKRKELLAKVISGVIQQSHKVNKIIIVDNNSNDGTQELVKDIQSASDIKIDYYNTGENLGGAGGFSYGFQKAMQETFDYLWIMDDDLLPSVNCLEVMVASANENKIIQPIRYNLDGSCAEYSPTKFDLSSPFIMRPKKETVLDKVAEKNINEKEITIDGIPFEGPLIPHKVINRIGLPDKNFFIFYDDLDYAIRARKAGFNIVCNTGAIANRLLVNNQSTDLRSWKGYFMLRNFFRIHRVHGDNFFVRSRPILIASLYMLKEIMHFRKETTIVCWHALLDAFSKEFNLRRKYIP
ncbi:glycosyltransferase family 2 protein [Erwinia sp. PK3-005]